MNDAPQPEKPRKGFAARLGGQIAAARRDIVLAFLDQGLNSLHSLVLALALIAFTEPATYGLFAFILTIVLIAASLQYGLVGIPILVHLRTLDPDAREDGLKTLLAADLWLRCAAAVVAGAGAFVATGDAFTGLGAAAFCALYLLRETARNRFYSRGQAASAAKLAAVAFLLLLPFYALLLQAVPPLLAPLLASTLATAIAIGLQGGIAPSWPKTPWSAFAAYRREFSGTGWTFANSAANEVQMRLYVFVILAARGADQLGVIEAGRILLAPLFLIVSAWQRVGQPRITSLIEDGATGAARGLTLAGVGLVVTAVTIWCAAIYFAWPLVERHLFDGFGDVSPYVTGWACYSVVLLANWSLAMFLNAAQRFRAVALVTMTAGATTAVLLSVMLLDVPLVTALYVLTAVQAGALIWLLKLVFSAPPVRRDD